MAVALYRAECRWVTRAPQFEPLVCYLRQLLCYLRLAEVGCTPAPSPCRQTMGASHAASKGRMARATQTSEHRAAALTASSIRCPGSGCSNLATCRVWRSTFLELAQDYLSHQCRNRRHCCYWERAFSARASERAACKADGARCALKTFGRRLLKPGRRRLRCQSILTSTIGLLRKLVEARRRARRNGRA